LGGWVCCLSGWVGGWVGVGWVGVGWVGCLGE